MTTIIDILFFFVDHFVDDQLIPADILPVLMSARLVSHPWIRENDKPETRSLLFEYRINFADKTSLKGVNRNRNLKSEL